MTEDLVLTRFDLSEVRMTEVDAAIAFAGGTGDGRGAWSLIHNLSILARSEGRIIGAALFFDGNVGRPRLEVSVDQTKDAEQDKPAEESEEQLNLLHRLAGVLVDKALLKLNSARRSRFSVHVGGRTDPGRFWADASWMNRQTAIDEATQPDIAAPDVQAITNPADDNPPSIAEEQQSAPRLNPVSSTPRTDIQNDSEETVEIGADLEHQPG